MIGSKAGVIWSYNDADVFDTFSEVNTLDVSYNDCGGQSICVWYVSPLKHLNDPDETLYAVLGEWNKWTAISRQRITEIKPVNTTVVVSLQGVPNEIVQMHLFHIKLTSVMVNCQMSADTGTSQITITTTNITCT